jgi:hypothetical protein
VADFDFVPNSHVAVEIAPDEQNVVSMNGWEFTSRPSTPYRRKFRLKMGGLYWRMNEAGTALDVLTDPTTNAGRLLNFYVAHRRWKSFTYQHEYLGLITCRFADGGLAIPEAILNSGGLVPEFELVLIHHNPSYEFG